MNEPTPNTQEEKEPVSPEEMLAFLQAEVAQHREEQRYYNRRAEIEAKSADTPNSEPEETAAQKRDHADEQRSNAGVSGRRADILERIVAVLEVLNHPGLVKVEYFLGLWGVCGYFGSDELETLTADAPMDALLAAHEALKAQEDTTSGKEDAGEAP